MYQFSLELRNKLINYIKKRSNVDVTQEKADEYLDSMADLYECFERMAKNN
jgi:hypothetical protein